MASEPARAGRVNEDFAGAAGSVAVLVDGAGIPGMEAVCRHGVAWYASRLGGCLLDLLPLPHRSLAQILADSIGQVTDEHRDTCDVADPISPSAAVAVLRQRDDLVEYLVLGDAYVVLSPVAGDGPLVVTDPREVIISRAYEFALRATADGSDEARRIIGELRANRNQADGFWLAKDDPRAAAEAVAGARPVSTIASAALLSNGASRLVDRFRLTSWPAVLAILAADGPAGMIDRVRRAEEHHAVSPDDATVVYCRDLAQA